MSEWISIEDQIPDEHEPVIISGWNFNNKEKGRYVEPAVRVGMDFWPPFERDEGFIKILLMEGEPFHQPTHWMPLPAAPGDTAQPAAEQQDHSGYAANMVHCACGDAYPASSFDAGFIIGSGMCQNCDAATPAKDIAAEQPEAVKVPLTLLKELRAFTLEHDSGRAGGLRGGIDAALRALLGKEGEV